MSAWFTENWFNIFTVFFGSGIWFAAFSIHKDSEVRKEDVKAKKVANLLAITANHREVWKEFLHNPKLARVRSTKADIAKHPLTDAEDVFITLVILHTNSVYYAMNHQLVVEYEGLQRDIAEFFSLPLPRAVWRKTKPLQNQDFAAFIDSSLK